MSVVVAGAMAATGVRSQNDVPCTTVVQHTEEPLSDARQTAVRADKT